MGLAIKINVLQAPSATGELILAAPPGTQYAIGKHQDQVVLIFHDAVDAPECLGSAMLLNISANDFGSDNELITLTNIRWLANPKVFATRRKNNARGWMTVPSVEFGLMLGQINKHNSWASAPPFVPVDTDIPYSLAQEVLRTANGLCQLTGSRSVPEEPVVPVAIRSLAEGGEQLPGNFLAIRKDWSGSFAEYHLSIGIDRRIVATVSRLKFRLSQLSEHGYLLVPNDTHREVHERNLAWHFQRYLKALQWPSAPF